MKRSAAILSMLPAVLALLHAPAARGATTYIDTPDLCTKVQRVEGNRVYLVSDGSCPKVVGKVAVTTEGGAEAEVFLNGSFWKRQEASVFDLGTVGGMHDRGEQLSRKLTLPGNPHRAPGEARARATDGLFRSGEFQQRLAREEERIRREVFGGRLQQFYQGAHQSAAAMAGELPRDERIYIFISSSMPRRTLRNYVRDAARLDDPNVKLVLRGLVGGMKYIKPTMRFFGSLLVKDEDCDPARGKCEMYGSALEVDPLLFRRYGIDRVPAIVFARRVNVVDPQMSEGMKRNMSVGEYHVLSGDVSLEHALDRFRSETGSQALQSLVTRLNSGFYAGRGQEGRK